MKRFATLIPLAAVLALGVLALARSMANPDAHSDADDAPSAPAASPFIALDVIIDSGTAGLGAYQVEITPRTGARAQLVGIEGGDAPVFSAPPAYDPEALHRASDFDRVILAAFSTNGPAPVGPTRVARVHFHTDSPAAPAFSIRLIRAGDPDANPIRATATLVPVNTRGPNR